MRFIIKGGKILKGEIALGGAKNAATKMMVASLLTEEECVLNNFPDIGDTEITAELCKSLGSIISIKNNSLYIKTPQITNCKVTSLSRRNRIPILALGPLLGRVGEAEVPFLGGDKIGARPVDLHLDGLRVMGAEIIIREDSYVARAPKGLRGAKIELKFPSVGATENIILAAVLAKGRTTILNAAKEPEVIALIKMLQNMGAIIEIGAHRTIYIDGVEKLRGTSCEILTDRNEAVSFGSLALATNGDIFVKGASQDHLITFLSAVRRVGGDYEVGDGGIRFFRMGNLKASEIETDTHPGFMTDWQQPLSVVLTQAHGTSIIHETIYEDRFGYMTDLNAMGANTTVFSKCLGELPCRFNGSSFAHSAVINGVTKLKGANLKVRDLRSGIAHIIAALTAEGASIIEGIEEIDRGYYKIEERLHNLGANITRVND